MADQFVKSFEIAGDGEMGDILSRRRKENHPKLKVGVLPLTWFEWWPMFPESDMQERIQADADKFVELMKATARPLDHYYTNKTKVYNYNHSSAGYTVVKMNLNDYRGKMGTLIDAGALLEAIKGAGSDMRVPNITVAPDKSQTIDLARFFVDGETLFYSVEGTDAAVAKAEVAGTMLLITGVASGSTTATITAGEKTQTISITVRKSGNNGGWM